MRIGFRQGIIQYPISNNQQTFLTFGTDGHITLAAGPNGPVDVSFAQKTTDYLLTEAAIVENAWGPIDSGIDTWLYWDIDLRSAVRTFGTTTIAPIVSIIAPPAPVEGQHWFDVAHTSMMLYSNGAWKNVIRVFAAKVNTNTFTGLGNNIATPFGGSQVNINVPTFTGRILIDSTGNPIRQSSTGTFFTTEDEIFVNGSPINAIRLESNVLTATADAPLAAYHVVRVTDPGHINYAGYNDAFLSMTGMLLEGLVVDQVGTLISQGTVYNPSWRWLDAQPEGAGLLPGDLLWVSENGQLIGQDPHLTDNITYPISYPPVAKVFDNNTIFFDQSMGGGGTATGGVTSFNTRTGAVTLTAGDIIAAQPYVPVNKAGDSMVGALVLNGDPTDPLQAATKQYVDNAVTGSAVVSFNGRTGAVTLNGTDVTNALGFTPVNKTGDTMSGFLTLNANPTSNLHAATKLYVDQSISAALTGSVSSFNGRTGAIILGGGDVTNALGFTPVNKAGDTMTGLLTLSANPSNAFHAATKQYVDNLITGLNFKQAVRAATTTNITMSGLLTVDGVALNVGDRVLVKNQTNGIDNGIYVAATGTWNRSPDADGAPPSEVTSGMYMFVGEGLTNASSGWVLSTANPVIGTTPLTFVQFTGLGQFEAGNGLVKNGSTIDVVSANTSRIIVNADNIDLATTGVVPGTYNAVTVDGYGRITAGSTQTFLTGNQTITLSGDVSGTGATSIVTTLANIGTPVTNQFVKITTDAKGRVTATSPVTSGDLSSLVSGAYVLKAGDTMTGLLTLSGSPVNNLHAATKQYVDTAVGSIVGGVSSFNTRTGAITLTLSDVTTALTYTPVNKTGDTMTGFLTLNANPTSNLHAVTKQYVDNAVAGAVGGAVTSFNTRTGAITLTSSDVTTALTFTPVNKAGDSMTGALTLTVPATLSQHAVTKGYVDAAVSSIVAGVSSFNTRTGAVTLTSGDVTTALSYTPVNKAGDTMTGFLVLSANPTLPLHAATKQYVDSIIGGSGVSSFNTRTGAVTLLASDITAALGYTPANGSFVSKTGDTMTGNLGIGGAPNTTLTVTKNSATPPGVAATAIGYFAGTNGQNAEIIVDSFAATSGSAITLRAANGTGVSPSAVSNNQIIGQINAYGYGTNAYATIPRATISLRAAEAWTNTANGTYIQFSTTVSGTNATRIAAQINNDTSVSLGGVPGAEALRAVFGSTVNRLEVYGSGAGSPISLVAAGSDTNISINLVSKGTGSILVNGSPIGSGGVTSFNTRTGVVTLQASDVTGALTYTPVNKTGDTMTGFLTLNANPTSALHAATKQYVDAAVGGGGSGSVSPTPNTLVLRDGSGNAFAVNFVTSSDAKLKENIVDIDNAFDTVCKMQGKSFNFIDDDRTTYGFIAQEMAEVLPEIVYSHKDGTLGVNYTAIIAFLVESLKQVRQELDQLKNNK